MRNIFFVTRDQNDLARRAEQLLIELSPVSGILFVSASIVETGNDWGLSIVVGCSRSVEASTAEALVWSVVVKDPDLEVIKQRTNVQAYRGVARSS